MIKTDTKLKNCPSKFEEISNLLNLVLVLNRLRICFAKPIIVNSGYRSPQVNAAVGGVYNSKHVQGLAADITCNPLDFEELVSFCKCFKETGHFSEMIVHSNYIHVAI